MTNPTDLESRNRGMLIYLGSATRGASYIDTFHIDLAILLKARFSKGKLRGMLHQLITP